MNRHGVLRAFRSITLVSALIVPSLAFASSRAELYVGLSLSCEIDRAATACVIDEVPDAELVYRGLPLAFARGDTLIAVEGVSPLAVDFYSDLETALATKRPFDLVTVDTEDSSGNPSSQQIRLGGLYAEDTCALTNTIWVTTSRLFPPPGDIVYVDDGTGTITVCPSPSTEMRTACCNSSNKTPVPSGTVETGCSYPCTGAECGLGVDDLEEPAQTCMP